MSTQPLRQEQITITLRSPGDDYLMQRIKAYQEMYLPGVKSMTSVIRQLIEVSLALKEDADEQ